MMVRIAVRDRAENSSVQVEGMPGSGAVKKLRFANRVSNVHVVSPTSALHLQDRGATSSRSLTAGKLLVSRALSCALRLPVASSLQARIVGDELHLGPCVGIYAEPSPSLKRQFGEQTQLFSDLAKLGQLRGVDVIVITPGFQQSQAGWRFACGTWQHCHVPVPDVVFRRSGVFRKEMATKAERDLAAFATQGRLHTLPYLVSNKWVFYNTLQKSQALRRYAPFTTRAASAADIWREVQERRDVYVKPIAGARGKSVFRIEREPRKWRLTWESPQADAESSGRDPFRTVTRSRSFEQQSELRALWSAYGVCPCVVQDTVQLMRTADRQAFDLRWLVQVTDAPAVTARVARIGRPGAVTTNVHTGGKAADAKELLRQLFGSAAGQIVLHADEAALEVARELIRRWGPCAEVGVDLAVRANASIAIFEVNPTPGRRMLRQLSAETRELSLLSLLEYAVRATGFESSGR